MEDQEEMLRERSKNTFMVIGQVYEVDFVSGNILLHLTGMLDEETEYWLPIPKEMPFWALQGSIFNARVSDDVTTFEDLSNRRWALRNFVKPVYQFTVEELEVALGSLLDL